MASFQLKNSRGVCACLAKNSLTRNAFHLARDKTSGRQQPTRCSLSSNLHQTPSSKWSKNRRQPVELAGTHTHTQSALYTHRRLRSLFNSVGKSNGKREMEAQRVEEEEEEEAASGLKIKPIPIWSLWAER